MNLSLLFLLDPLKLRLHRTIVKKPNILLVAILNEVLHALNLLRTLICGVLVIVIIHIVKFSKKIFLMESMIELSLLW